MRPMIIILISHVCFILDLITANSPTEKRYKLDKGQCLHFVTKIFPKLLCNAELLLDNNKI